MVDKLNRRNWYIAIWPPLAWLETAIKSIAIAVGITALIRLALDGSIDIEADRSLAELVILGILSFGLVIAILDRLKEREVIAMAFVLANNAGHWGMFIALAGEPGPGWMFPAFCSIFLVGDMVKILFIKHERFTVRNTSQPVLIGMTSVYAAGYSVLLILNQIL